MVIITPAILNKFHSSKFGWSVLWRERRHEETPKQKPAQEKKKEKKKSQNKIRDGGQIIVDFFTLLVPMHKANHNSGMAPRLVVFLLLPASLRADIL